MEIENSSVNAEEAVRPVRKIVLKRKPAAKKAEATEEVAEDK